MSFDPREVTRNIAKRHREHADKKSVAAICLFTSAIALAAICLFTSAIALAGIGYLGGVPDYETFFFISSALSILLGVGFLASSVASSVKANSFDQRPRI